MQHHLRHLENGGDSPSPSPITYLRSVYVVVLCFASSYLHISRRVTAATPHTELFFQCFFYFIFVVIDVRLVFQNLAMEEMSYFGIYISPSKAVFEGTMAQCAGSIAAVSIKALEASKSGPGPASRLGQVVPAEDSDYPRKCERDGASVAVPACVCKCVCVRCVPVIYRLLLYLWYPGMQWVYPTFRYIALRTW